MKTFFNPYKNEARAVVPQSAREISLTRTFVETGDERCPLAGIWSQLPTLDACLDDETGLAWPASGVLLFGALRRQANFFCVACPT